MSSHLRKPTVITIACWVIALCSVQADGQEECGTTSTLGSDIQISSLLCTGPCPSKGACDCRDTRDLWDSATSDVTVRVIIHVFDTGVTQQMIDDQKQKIKDDLITRKINLVVEDEIIPPGSGYEVLYSESDVTNMKNDYAETPDQKLNVYVSDLHAGLGYLGQGRFPWDPDALGTQGGIIIDGGCVRGQQDDAHARDRTQPRPVAHAPWA